LYRLEHNGFWIELLRSVRVRHYLRLGFFV
jgi:hypothetical protein